MGSGTSVVRWATAALIAIVAALVLVPTASAADRNFASRFTANDTGDILAIGNTLMTCPPAAAGCTAALGSGSATVTTNELNNNNYNMVYVDTDADASTFNSSSSNLNLPAGAQVLFAGLYWGGEVTAGNNGAAAPNAAARNVVRFKTPGGAYQNLTATTLDDGAIIYQGFKDVTSLVQAGGNGSYFTGNVQTGTGSDRLGGWSLVIAYRDTTQPARNLTVFDGLTSISGSSGSKTINVSGFLTPPVGAVKTELGFITYEGDAGLVGDSASLNSTVLSDATHPATNFFNSHISRDGVNQGGKNPDYLNQLGYDISYVKADGILANSATSANITVTTSGDVYAPGVITFATEIYAPKINQTKSVVDDNGGLVEQGDTLTYTISGSNNGQDGTSGFILRDPVPANTVYVPGSIVLTNPAGNNPAGASDATDNDRAEFDSTGNRVIARLGTGSNGTSGGNVMPGNSYSVSFKVKVNGPATNAVPQDTKIPNTATSSFFSQTTGTPLTSVSTVTSTVAAPDLKITKTRTGPPLQVGGTSSYTIKVANVGNAKTQGTVTVSDTLPNNLSASSFNAPGWTCTGQTSFTCTRSDALAAGASYPDIVLNVTVGAGTNTSVSNTAVVSGGGDGNLGNNSSTDTSPATESADIALTKVASQKVVNIGDELDFTLVVTNNGLATATSVAISDPIPGEFTYLSDNGACIFTPPTGVLGCVVGTLAKGASKTIKVRVRAEADGATKSISNTATAKAQQTDPDPTNNSGTATVAVTGVDLAVTKTIDNATPNAGDTVTYTLKVRNNGPSRATAVVLKDTLPPELTNVSTNDTGHCTIVASELSCNAGNLESGAEYTVSVSGSIAIGTTSLVNNAGVAGAEPDPDPSNNTAQVTTPVAAPVAADLAIVKSASAAQVSAGDPLTYTLAVHNNGPNDAPNVTVSDTLPAGVSFVSASGGCTESAGTVTCALGTVPSGGDASVTVTVTVTASTGSLANTATVAGGVTDPNPGNNTSTTTTPIVSPSPDVSITKTVDDTTPASGGTVVYTLTAKNNGAVPATGVLVTDALPAGVTFQSVSGTNCSQASGTVTCNIGTLAPGASSVVKITAKVASASTSGPGTHQFTVNKVEGQVDIDPGQTKTVSVDCGPGFILTDGSVRTDAVDQGTGDLASVHVLAAHGTTASGYTATVRNDATGRAQAKIFGVCLSSSTTNEGGHSHDVIVSAPVTTTAVLGSGRQTATVDCGPGKTPIQPGYDLAGGDGRLVGSEPTISGTGWVFTVDTLAGGPTATFSVRCLDDHVTFADGHTHTLGLERRTKSITVAPGQTVEVEVICGDNAKGIVGDYYVDPGLVALGNDPRPKTRSFKFYNPTGAPLNARVGLLCLDDRTGPATALTTLTNTGTVTATTPDSDQSNNTASAVVNVGGSALTRSGKAKVAGSAVLVRGSKATVRVACLKGGPACVGTVQIKTMTNRKIATRKYSVRAARTGTLIVTAKAFKTLKRAKFIVTGRDGRRTTQTVKIKKAPVLTAAAKRAAAKKAAAKKAAAKKALAKRG